MIPLVSIIVPAYNRADLLRETLESVRRQGFADWECLVVDDGSTDHTRRVVNEFIRADQRFRYVWQENSSAANARNRGIELARGEYLVFLDSDDLLPEDRLEWQVPILRARPDVVLVYGDAFHFRGGNISDGFIYMQHVADKPSGDAFHALLTCSAIYSPMVRRSAIVAAGGFDTSLESAEDWDMWLRVAKQGLVVFEPRIALYYRLHSENKSSNLLRNYLCARRVADKHLGSVGLPMRMSMRRRVARYFRRGYRDLLLRQACLETGNGNWQRARLLWRVLVKLDPGVLFSRAGFSNGCWALLPTESQPFWRVRPAAASGGMP